MKALGIWLGFLAATLLPVSAQVTVEVTQDQSQFLPSELRALSGEPSAHGDLAAELARHFALGVDGVFADQPDIAVAVRAES